MGLWDQKLYILEYLAKHIDFSNHSNQAHKSQKYQKYTYFGKYTHNRSKYTFCYQNIHISENLNKISKNRRYIPLDTKNANISGKTHVFSKKRNMPYFQKIQILKRKYFLLLIEPPHKQVLGIFSVSTTFVH